MARKAVAAALVSVILFSVLVVADATVMSAQDNLASSAQASETESRELILEQSLAGAVSLQVLAQVQSYLSSVSAECSSLREYLGSISATNSTSGVGSGIAYTANASAAESPVSPEGDNLTIIAPFAGAVTGTLALRENLSVKEVGGGGSISLTRHETHNLNIPVEVGYASSLCGSTLRALAAALSRSPCNATLEQAAFDSVLPGLVKGATSDGFALTADWASDGAACGVAYWITLVEPGVPGVTGSFDWTVRGTGTAA